MNAFHHLIERLAGLTLGDLVHIGAGRGDLLDRLVGLGPKRLILVEGDADAVDALRARAARIPFAVVKACAVASTPGSIDWNRYTLESLNGPLGIDGLVDYLPRARRIATDAADARSLRDLLDEVALSTDPSRVNVLVLDVPGQEGALLESLARERLAAFGFVMIRSCRESLGDAASAGDDASRRLQHAFFDLEAIDADSQPLWPCSLLRLNPHRLQLVESQEAVGLLTTRLAQALSQKDDAQGALRAAQHERDAQGALAVSLRRTVDSLEARLRDQVATTERLGHDADAVRQIADEREHRIGSLAEACSGLEARLAAQDRIVIELRSANSEHLQARERASKQIDELRAEAGAARQHVAVLQQALDDGTARFESALADKEADKQATEQRNAQWLAEVVSLRDSISVGESAAAELSAALVEKEQEARTEQHRANRLQLDLSELARQLAEAGARLHETTERLDIATADRDSLHDRLSRATLQLSEREAELDTRREESVRTIARHRAELDAAAAASSAALRRAEAAEARLVTVESELGTQVGLGERLQAELADARQSVSLGLRLLTLREADLADLQARYAHLVERDRERHALLGALATRVAAVDRWLKQSAAASTPDEGVESRGTARSVDRRAKSSRA